MNDAPADTPARDYRGTVFLPKTDFPMRGDLPKREPGWLERWERIGLWQRLRDQSKGREKFVLHDGPPYANGPLHIGTALNKILKDVINRAAQMSGKDADYVPGWDCHGLPIEWKVEEQYRSKKLNKDAVPAAEFRAECRAYAERWIDVQREQFQRLGVLGDWDDPYITMTYEAEAAIAAELLKFARSGQVYRGAKPVMWSPVEKTALAEAEIEYADKKSPAIDVAYHMGIHTTVYNYFTASRYDVSAAIASSPSLAYAHGLAPPRKPKQPESELQESAAAAVSAGCASALLSTSDRRSWLSTPAATNWNTDTGASAHMTPHRHWFRSY